MIPAIVATNDVIALAAFCGHLRTAADLDLYTTFASANAASTSVAHGIDNTAEDTNGRFFIAAKAAANKRKDYLQKACDILLTVLEPERPCGYVENIGREGTRAVTCTLGELRDAEVNMFTTVFVGNQGTEIIDKKLVTKRGYQIEKNTDFCRDNGR